jgi:hypothetical protein
MTRQGKGGKERGVGLGQPEEEERGDDVMKKNERMKNRNAYNWVYHLGREGKEGREGGKARITTRDDTILRSRRFLHGRS